MGAAGRGTGDAIALGRGGPGAGQGRRHRHRPYCYVGFIDPDDLEGGFLVGVLIGEQHRGAELDIFAGELLDIDNLGAADLVLDLADPPLDEGLFLFRGVIFGVLTEIAVLPRGGDRRDDRRPLDVFQLLEFFQEHLVAPVGHRYSIHGADSNIHNPNLSPSADRQRRAFAVKLP